jgi:TetR/AcrR family transcriptional regulator, cholesterol catabolism regulator
MPRHSTRPRAAPPRATPAVQDLPAGQRERRERIVDAAVEMMIEVDYDHIQVKDVAERAGVALGTLYRYFSSKDHLMTCALLEWSSSFAERVEQAGVSTSVQRVKAVYGRAARAFEHEPRVFDALIQLQAGRDPQAAALFSEFGDRQTAAFGAALDDLPADTRNDIVHIMSAVLAESLRGCQRGTCTRADVHRRIDRAAELLIPG